MARAEVGPCVICDGCAMPIDLEMSADNTDPSKGMLVDEDWVGKCGKCHYEFKLRILMKEDDDAKTTNRQ